MAIILPMHRAAARTAQDYTAESFVNKLITAVKSKDDGKTLESFFYKAFVDEMEKEKTNLIDKYKPTLDSVVTLARQYGYDLTPKLTSAILLSKMNINPPITNPGQYMKDNFDHIMENVLTYLKSSDFNMPPKADFNNIETTIKSEYSSKLAEYGISTMPTSGQLFDNIKKLTTYAQEKYKTFIGTFFPGSNQQFYDKTGFDVTTIVSNEINTNATHTAILAEVKKQMQEALTNAVIDKNADSRLYHEAKYNYTIKQQQLTFNKFSTDFFGGSLATSFNKFTKGGHVSIDQISASYPTIYKNTNTMQVSFELKLVVDSQHETLHKDLTIPLHKYSIIEMSKVVNEAFHNKVIRLPKSTSTSFTDGQTLSRNDLESIAFKGGDNVNLKDMFDKLDAIKHANPQSDYTIKFDKTNGKISISYIDNSIKSTDFDYGDINVPGLTSGNKIYVMDRHISHESIPNSFPTYSANSNEPNFVINGNAKIEFVSIMDNLVRTLLNATADSKQPLSLSIDEFLNKDGSFKPVDLTLIKKAFPNFETEFADVVKTHPGYTWDASTSYVDHIAAGFAHVNVVISDGSGGYVAQEILIKTIDENLIIQEIKDKMDKYENTWEDGTPSHMPTGFTNPTDPGNPWKAGGNISLHQLDSIFNNPNISSLQSTNVQIVSGPLTEETHASKLTTDMLMSWNQQLISSLGADTQQLRTEIDKALNELINSKGAGLISLLGMDQSKYVMANVTSTYKTKTSTNKLIAVHYLSPLQRIAETMAITKGLDLMGKANLESSFKDFDLTDDLKNEIMAKFNVEKAKVIAKVESLLKPNDPSALVPDWMLSEIETSMDGLKHFVTDLKDKYQISKDDLNKLKDASKAFKYVLAGIGGALGIAGLTGLMIPARTARANRKFNKENNAKRSSKGLIAISTIAGLLSIGASVGIMLYIFVAQGGF